jgi:hypothetical protein
MIFKKLGARGSAELQKKSFPLCIHEDSETKSNSAKISAEKRECEKQNQKSSPFSCLPRCSFWRIQPQDRVDHARFWCRAQQELQATSKPAMELFPLATETFMPISIF